MPELVKVTAEQRTTPPDDIWLKSVCRVGQGAECCRYIACGPQGFSCEKNGRLGTILNERAINGLMTARADNCEGRASV